jgi:chromosome segregation protein
MTVLSAAPAPRLTRLELQGFKSFASKTVFVFEEGITAVIGPNGSGKSNVADGVRWVLGEQSYSALRGKKTEDVIFAGGQGRAPAGLAEVTVTFDNSTGWLPSEYTEVTVTRRAFRGGENQYLINGRRVRLKDVQILTASLGQSHLIVGQGLVDAALSQRAEERMTLFEHAADLTGLRIKAVEAEKSLAETEQNANRIRDLLTEVEPRLRSLERAARQSREYITLRDRRVALQWRLERELLAVARTEFAAAQADSQANATSLDDARAALDIATATLADARAAAASARAALDQHTSRQQTVSEEAQRVGHERDLAGERFVALSRRREDMAETERGLVEQQQRVATDLAAVTAAIAAIEAEREQAQATAREIERAVAGARDARAAREREAGTLQRDLDNRQRQQNDLARQRALRAQRQETDAGERERAEVGANERRERIAGLETELAALLAGEATGQARLTELETLLRELGQDEARASEEERAARARLDAAEREASRLAARHEALQRLHESGAGLYQGVKAVVQAGRQGQLTGIRGPVVELVQSPARYETAIEVALGGHLQDIVVERWADAEAAIALLKKSNAGRATFQPLDTVRGRRDERGTPREVADLAGVHGVAAGLVGLRSDDLEPVVWSLLGRTLVVDDLAATRAALRALPGGWSVVTLTGEIARSSGAVTGGAAVKESGMLGRERELRELPALLTKQEGLRGEAVAAMRAAQERARALQTERRAADSERAGLLAAGKERAAQRDRTERWLAGVKAEQAAAASRLASLAAAATTAGEEVAALDAQIAALATELARLAEDLATARAALDADVGSAREREQELAGHNATLATLEERLRAERRRETTLRAQQQAGADELGMRQSRAAALDGERAAIDAQRIRLEVEARALYEERDRVIEQRPPLEKALRQSIADATAAEQALEKARDALLSAERQHGARELVVERCHAEVRAIEQRVRDDLELEDPGVLLEQEPPPLEGDLPDGNEAMEREIHRLRERMKRVGYVGENAVEEFERESERHVFLTTQIADVEGASAALRNVLADLRQTMKERFDETFQRVSLVFAEMFSVLFGGGSARLVVVGGEDGDTHGIDIVAQPPGKRLQNMALLSGGERSLTAVALLFAILKVNPTPFCLLDEVDAALDEANVVRFRDQLRRLARETQAIVITHNRGTIEIADNLYGVSMGSDGVSQVLSLRLAGIASA